MQKEGQGHPGALGRYSVGGSSRLLQKLAGGGPGQWGQGLASEGSTVCRMAAARLCAGEGREVAQGSLAGLRTDGLWDTLEQAAVFVIVVLTG